MNAFIVIVVAALATYAIHQIGVFKPRPATAEKGVDVRAAIAKSSDRLQRAQRVSELLECVSAITPAVAAPHVTAWTSRSAGGIAATSASVALPRTADSGWVRARYPLTD